MSGERVLQKLMLELIYPAVLGTVIYGFLSFMPGLLIDAVRGSVESTSLPSKLSFKLALYVVTLLFYCADYIYVMLTKEYNWAFFGLDLAFIGGLYVSIYSIHAIDAVEKPANLSVILWCYIIFMTLYFVWDLFEQHRTANGHEKDWYRLVLSWEIISVVALGYSFRLLSFGTPACLVGIVVVLGAITAEFFRVCWKKRSFYPAD